MLYFEVVLDGCVVRHIKEKDMRRVLENYQAYAKKKKFTKAVYDTDSFGNSAMMNKRGQILYLVSID